MAFLNYFQDQVPHVTQAHPKMERLLHNLQANTSLEEDLLFCSEQGYNFTCPDKNRFASSVQPSLLHIPIVEVFQEGAETVLKFLNQIQLLDPRNLNDVEGDFTSI